MRVIVTAGGTREPIDDVRVLTNVSTGRFGYELASAFHARGCEVVLIGAEEMRERRWYQLPFDPIPFGGVEDLRTRLHAAIADRRPDVLLMAAAVSDYVVVHRTAGKMPSQADQMTIQLTRTAKILDTLRGLCGEGCFLVGFKLLSRATEAVLRAAAEEQNQRCRLDATVANDLSGLTSENHPVWIATPAGDWIPLDGTKAVVAGKLADWVIGRRK